MSQPVQLDTILSGIATKADGSLSLRFSTLELSPEHTLPLLALRNQNLLMTLAPIGSDEMPMEIESESSAKTPSQRLRAVLHVLWESQRNTLKGEPFSIFYEKKMESIIIWLKNKLPE